MQKHENNAPVMTLKNYYSNVQVIQNGHSHVRVVVIVHNLCEMGDTSSVIRA